MENDAGRNRNTIVTSIERRYWIQRMGNAGVHEATSFVEVRAEDVVEGGYL
jgi:hypothetical protein